MSKKRMGPITHSDQVNYLNGGTGSKDPHAHHEHHRMNKEHGTPLGLHHAGGYKRGGKQHGGEGMSENCEYCE